MKLREPIPWRVRAEITYRSHRWALDDEATTDDPTDAMARLSDELWEQCAHDVDRAIFGLAPRLTV